MEEESPLLTKTLPTERLDQRNIPLTRPKVSAHLIFPGSDGVQSKVVDLIPEVPVLLPAQAVPESTRPRYFWLGILGLTMVFMILGLCVYSIMRFLL